MNDDHYHVCSGVYPPSSVNLDTRIEANFEIQLMAGQNVGLGMRVPTSGAWDGSYTGVITATMIQFFGSTCT